MLWVNGNLRRQSSRVWREEGLDALHFIKGFKYMVFVPKAVYLRTLLRG
ncbi:hypothetical protein SK3146_04982 [Paenibacillus konkukensis]|uniref:Uncharacterized protein n=1 Tax=Paenibacillus konkukensis TaxID=2020716 RepID=A0ABY4RVW0_9BACL|nr:hypothetical protein SK3146_04982 [Paenibacillus konkukensis]